MNLEIELDGHIYRIEQLDAIKQWHVFRRLIPVLSSFSGLVNMDKDAVRAGMLTTFLPAFEKLSDMSDADTDFILNTCLMSVTRKDKASGGWQRVMVKPGMIQFSDIGFITMLQLTKYVVMENLSDFFTQTASADLAEAEPAADHSSP